MTVTINYSVAGGGGGSGGGANLGSNNPQPLGIAAAGTDSTFASRQDHVHVMPTANDVGANAYMIPWNLDTNVATPATGSPFTPASSTFPSGGNTVLLASGSTPRTLDTFVYAAGDVAEYSPALGVWVHISGAAGTNGVTRPASNYTAGSAWTGSTSESAAQMTLQLVGNTTTLVAGQKFEVIYHSSLSSDSAQTTVKHYVNGAIVLSALSFQVATFTSVTVSKLTMIVIDATHVLVRIECDTGTTTRAAAEAIQTVTTGTGLACYITYTNTTTGKTATPVLADSRFFQP